MPCKPIADQQNETVGFVCGFHSVYDYDGYLFELHSYLGPVPLRKDTHEPRTTKPAGFWPAWIRFQKLSKEEQEKYRLKEHENS